MNIRTCFGMLFLLPCFLTAAFADDSQLVKSPGGIWQLSAPTAWKVQNDGQTIMMASPDGPANIVIYSEALQPGSAAEWLETLIPGLQREIPGWKLRGKQPSTAADREGLLARAENLTQSVPMHIDHVLAKGATHQEILSYNCSKADFAANQLTFGRIIEGVKFEDTSLQISAAPAPKQRTSSESTGQKLQVKWENYISRHLTFTIVKPSGWRVEEAWQENPAQWRFTIAEPRGLYSVSCTHGYSPAGRDAMNVARYVVGELSRQRPGLELAPTARSKRFGEKTVFLFEGTWVDAGNQRHQFRSLVTGGDGMMLHQQIDAVEGRLDESAPVLLQTLANLRIAKNVFPFDEGSTAQANRAQSVSVTLVPRRIGGGWGTFSAPADWQQTDLGKGQLIAMDPSQQIFFIAALVEFYNPRYANLIRSPGVLFSEFKPPHQALAFACVQQGVGSDFRFQVHERPDMVAWLRANLTGGRPCSAEDFAYTFRHKGRPYRGISLGYCVGTYMDATFSLGHTTVWAPAEQFDSWLPTLGQIMASYRLNEQKVGEYIRDGLAKYYKEVRKTSEMIAANSEQMRRENYQLFMERGRVSDYTSYQTTRMIMGEYDYLAGASGYVRGDPSGLYTAEGNRITSDPYGGSVTRGMQEINSRQIYEAVRPR